MNIYRGGMDREMHLRTFRSWQNMATPLCPLFPIVPPAQTQSRLRACYIIAQRTISTDFVNHCFAFSKQIQQLYIVRVLTFKYNLYRPINYSTIAASCRVHITWMIFRHERCLKQRMPGWKTGYQPYHGLEVSPKITVEHHTESASCRFAA